MAPTALIVLDGWGIAPPGQGNATTLAETPVFDQLWARYPHTELSASGLAVGLPEGQIGNSEVGHMNLGAGRVVMQKQTYIQALIDEGGFYENEVLRNLFGIKREGSSLHLMGLVSDGGVHSDLNHFYALLEMAKSIGVPNVYIHVFTDGRDVGPSTAIRFMEEFQGRLAEEPNMAIATVSGRYYAMDRDKRWSRTQLAYDAIVCGKAEFRTQSAVVAVEEAYERGETDEFIMPTVLVDEAGEPVGSVKDGDSIFFFNFRADRVRQLSSALLLPDFDQFERCVVLEDIHYASMMKYDAALPAPWAFELPALDCCLAQVLAEAGKQQYHSAETEKYPHVTYFFNALREEPYTGESRFLAQSPKVATYDLQPEMSEPELTAATVKRIREQEDDFILQLRQPGHGGAHGCDSAAIAACEAVDEGLGQVLDALRAKGGRAIVLADHGNCEMMIDEQGGPHTAHTTNPVPCILVDDDYRGTLRGGGKLGDVAPTILALMGLAKPELMTGQSLLERA